jgi:hypothetical protein
MTICFLQGDHRIRRLQIEEKSLVKKNVAGELPATSYIIKGRKRLIIVVVDSLNAEKFSNQAKKGCLFRQPQTHDWLFHYD